MIRHTMEEMNRNLTLRMGNAGAFLALTIVFGVLASAATVAQRLLLGEVVARVLLAGTDHRALGVSSPFFCSAWSWRVRISCGCARSPPCGAPSGRSAWSRSVSWTPSSRSVHPAWTESAQ